MEDNLIGKIIEKVIYFYKKKKIILIFIFLLLIGYFGYIIFNGFVNSYNYYKKYQTNLKLYEKTNKNVFNKLTFKVDNEIVKEISKINSKNNLSEIKKINLQSQIGKKVSKYFINDFENVNENSLFYPENFTELNFEYVLKNLKNKYFEINQKINQINKNKIKLKRKIILDGLKKYNISTGNYEVFKNINYKKFYNEMFNTGGKLITGGYIKGINYVIKNTGKNIFSKYIIKNFKIKDNELSGNFIKFVKNHKKEIIEKIKLIIENIGNIQKGINNQKKIKDDIGNLIKLQKERKKILYEYKIFDENKKIFKKYLKYTYKINFLSGNKLLEKKFLQDINNFNNNEKKILSQLDLYQVIDKNKEIKYIIFIMKTNTNFNQKENLFNLKKENKKILTNIFFTSIYNSELYKKIIRNGFDKIKEKYFDKNLKDEELKKKRKEFILFVSLMNYIIKNGITPVKNKNGKTNSIFFIGNLYNSTVKEYLLGRSFYKDQINYYLLGNK